ncbi:MAG: hypothetical protein Crog4KO_31650 [Crocinitomicaceae bacterium]
MIGLKTLKKKYPVVLIVAIAALLRLAFLPLAQVVDADAVTRMFMAQEWWDNPSLITEGVWPPLHQYFYGIVYGCTGNLQTIPILVSILLASLAAWPMYLFVQREFNEKAAFWIALALALSPVLFRNSYHTLSGTPFVFLLLFSMAHLVKAWKQPNLKSAIWAGVFMTLACGFRYEGWMLLAVFTGLGLIQRAWKETAVFWLVSMIFPLFWMIGNYAAHQDFFFGLSGAYDWNVVQEGVNNYLPRDIMLLRWFFFPASWFFLFSPILVGAVIIALWKALRTKQFNWNQWRWGGVFLLLLVTFIYKSHEGTLLNQHRFTSSLIVFSLPMLALIWDLNVHWLKRTAQIGILSLLPLSFIWMKPAYQNAFPDGSSTHYALEHFQNISNPGMNAIPRLKNQEIVKIETEISKHLQPNSGLILDFIDWESTYYIALQSNLKRDQLFIFNGAANAKNYGSIMGEVVKRYPKGVLMVNRGSGMVEMIEFYGSRSRDEDYFKILRQEARILESSDSFMEVTLLAKFDDIIIYSYKRKLRR